MVVYNNILAGAAGSGGDAGYKIERSLRFDQTATAHLNRTPSTSGNKKKWTWSGWVKRCTNGNNDGLFEAEANGNYTLLRIRSDNDRISLDQYGGDNFYVYTDGVFRDNSAWYHIVCVVDTTQSTDSNRVKIYVNGVQQTLTAGTNWPSQNQDTRYNDSSYAMRVGGVNGGTQFDGYMADVQFLDGIAVSDPDGVFGEFDATTGAWNPIEYTGDHNFGTAVTHWRQATSADNPSSGTVGSITYRTQRALEDPQTSALVWDHQNTNVIGLQNITGVTSLRLLVSSRGSGAKIGLNTGAMFTVGSHGGDYNNAQANAAWYTVSNPPSSLTSIAATGGGSGTGNFCSVWGIEVNGVRVVDTTAGTNGFHLDFSDNSSNGALGDDRSRPDYNKLAGALTTTTGSGNFYSNTNPNRAFDGNTSNDVYGGWTQAGDDSNLIWSPPSGSYSVSSSLRVYAGYYSTIYVNGVSKATGNASNSTAWVTLAHTGAITEIKVENTTNDNVARISAIEIDGTVLVSNAWTVNNFTASGLGDTPGVTTQKGQDVTGDWLGILGIIPTNTNGTFATVPDGGGPTQPNKGKFYWSGLTIGDTITVYGTGSGQNRTVTGDVSEASSPGYVAVPGASLGSFTVTVTAASGSCKVDHNGAFTCYGITPGPLASRYFDDGLDSPTNYKADSGNNGGNYASWNPLTNKGVVTTSNGNLTANATNSGFGYTLSTIAVSSGKYYCEISFEGTMAHSVNYNYIGIVPTDSAAIYTGQDIFRADGALSIDSNSSVIRGTIGTGGGETNNTYQSSYGFDENDTIGIAIDCDTPQVTFYKNGTSIGTFPHTMQPNKSWALFVNDWANGADFTGYILNAGQRPFSYTPPTGYKSLCTQNLPDPLIADGSDHFDAKTYTGDGNNGRSVTGFDFSPDFVWIKGRDSGPATIQHVLQDTVRGTNKMLSSNEAYGESSFGVPPLWGYISSFNSDGFSLSTGGSGNAHTNNNNTPYVSWAWDGGDLVTNSAYDQSDVWSSRCTGTIYNASLGYENAFDGSTSTGSHSANGNTITFTPATAISVSSSIKIYYDIGSITGTSGSADITINGTSYVATAHNNRSNGHFTVTGVSSITSMVWERAADNDLIAVKAIEVDGKMLVDAGVIPVGSLTSSFYNQSQTWSSAAADTYGFDGSTAYNSAATRLYGTSTYHKIVDADNPFTNVTSVVVGTSENVGNIKLDGTVYTTSYTSGVGLTVTSPPSSFSDIEVLGASNGVQIAYVKISGVILVDSGVSLSGVTQYPSMASTVRANPTAGFSIVSYTGTGTSGHVVGHGLNQAPEFILTKRRDSTGYWPVYHKELASGYALQLDSNTSQFAGSQLYTSTAPTSSVFSVGNNAVINGSGNTYIAYCFASIEGYSAFGSYSGNGSLTNGSFISLGFTPALVIIKNTASSGSYSSWGMWDSARNINAAALSSFNDPLWANRNVQEGKRGNGTSAASGAENTVHLLSNGFQVFGNGTEYNNSGVKYVYAAWASNPFQHARAR